MAWTYGTVSLEWQTGILVPTFQEGGPECVFQLPGDLTPQPPWGGQAPLNLSPWLEKGGFPSPGWERIISPSGGVQVSRVRVHE